jgi:hypothetical protein
MAMKPKKSEKPGTSRDYVRSYIGSEPRYEVPTKAQAAKRKKEQSRQYSPAPMTAAAKAKAAAAGKATAARTKPKSTASKAAGLAGKVAGRVVRDVKSRAREVRDVPTSLANAISMWEANLGPNTKAGPQSGRMLKDIAKQGGEAARALLTGKKGTAPLKVTKNPKDKFYGSMTNREYIAKQAKPDNSRGNATKRNMKSGGKALTPAQLAKLKKMLSGRLDK